MSYLRGWLMNDVQIKNADEIALMRESGRLLAEVFAALDGYMGDPAHLSWH